MNTAPVAINTKPTMVRALKCSLNTIADEAAMIRTGTIVLNGWATCSGIPLKDCAYMTKATPYISAALIVQRVRLKPKIFKDSVEVRVDSFKAILAAAFANIAMVKYTQLKLTQPTSKFGAPIH